MTLPFSYKKTLLILAIISIPILFGNLYSTKYIIKSSGAHPGSTGAPGDVTCKHNGCHADATVNNNIAGVTTFDYPNLDSTYIPGQTYTINLKVQKATIARFGFELCALENVLNDNGGTLMVTDSARTQLIWHPKGEDLRYSLTHKYDGTPATPSIGQTTWSFQWTAPSTDIGKITFYYCVNCTNNNADNTGDDLYLNTFVVHPAINTDITKFMDESKYSLYFDPINKEIITNYFLKLDKQVEIKITDALGKEVHHLSQSRLKGNITEKFSMDNFSDGVYIVNLMIDNTILSKKIIVR